ncbi:hypothetical protein [Sphaerisporangium sp. TRM90804]|uniref:hypothetical protein n=1 Tax=Sphaerisporangium sp. TRM90804 TaxID=3031113 RepID=UPI00244A9E20|nr:hypothetical protein [Sphaerisporangium sp. TRM90804]MDH2423815.1 hypothetical protein [Sphaerisporangium sp. TRM90804]
MRKIRNLLVSTALAGSLAAGIAATAPAAQAETSAAAGTAVTAEAQAARHFFGPIYSTFGRGEDRGHRSYFKGHWKKSNGRYWFYGSLFDRDRDRDYSYVWFRWHDDRGFHAKYYKTFGKKDFSKFGGFRKSSGFDDFDIRVCEGDNRFDDCGRWSDVF